MSCLIYGCLEVYGLLSKELEIFSLYFCYLFFILVSQLSESIFCFNAQYVIFLNVQNPLKRMCFRPSNFYFIPFIDYYSLVKFSLFYWLLITIILKFSSNNSNIRITNAACFSLAFGLFFLSPGMPSNFTECQTLWVRIIQIMRGPDWGAPIFRIWTQNREYTSRMSFLCRTWTSFFVSHVLWDHAKLVLCSQVLSYHFSFPSFSLYVVYKLSRASWGK